MTQKTSEILVRKRSGAMEKFDAEKTNKIIRWACDGIKDVTENEIGLAFHTNIKHGISTKDIHKGIIQATVSLITENTPNYEIVAANLLNYELRKDVWGGKEPPNFLDFIKNNIKNKRYTKEILDWFSEDEITEFGKYIDHERDFNFRYSGLSQVIDKYLVKNLADKKVYETPNIAYMLIAMCLFHTEKDKIKDAYDAFSLFKISLPTPIFAGVRTNMKSFASCLLLDMGDSVDEICTGFEVIAKATANRFGIGANFTKMRPIGSPIRGGENVHTGKVGFLRTVQDTIKTWLQGCYDDQTEILTADGWKYFSELADSANEIKVAQVSDDNEISFVKPLQYFKYPVNEELIHFKDSKNIDLLVTKNHNMVYKTLQRINHKRINNKHTTHKRKLSDNYYMKDADSVPLHGDIRFQHSSFGFSGTGLSWEDKFRIALQADGTIKEGRNNVYTFHFRKERKIKRLEEILTNLPMKYSKTIVSDGSTCFYISNIEKEYSKYFDWINIDNISKEWANEFVLELFEWDGSKRPNSNCNGSYYTEHEGNANMAQAIASLCGYKSSLSKDERKNKKNSKPLYKVYFSKGEYFGVNNVSKEYVHYDGYVYCVEVPSNKLIVRRNGKPIVCGNSTRSGAATITIPIWDYEIEEIIQLKDIMRPPENRVGDIDYTISFSKLFYDRWATNQQITLFNAHEVPELEKYFGLPEFDELYIKAENNPKIKMKKKVSARELFALFNKFRIETGRLYVNNIDHLNSHSSFKEKLGMLNLCLEVAHPVTPMKYLNDPDGLLGICILCAINPINIKTDEELEHICELAVRMLDNLIDYQSYFCVPAENFATKYRSLGIGITNFAAMLAKRGLKYSSTEAQEFAHEFFEKYQYFLIKASNKLAQERGKAEWSHLTKYDDGILPIDTYEKNIDSFIPNNLKMDWETLRENLKKYGIRNATLTCMMPCEASSLCTNSTNGLERPRSSFILKTNKSKDFPVIIPHSKKWNWEYAYENATNEAHIKMMAIVQKFTDMSISTNLYYCYNLYPDKQIPQSVINKDFANCYKFGLKSVYYTNTDDGNLHGLRDEEKCAGGSCTI